MVRIDDGVEDAITPPALRNSPTGWAISVHKAQGSAFKRIIIPVIRSKLLDRTMLYTAITRGIETVVLVGDIDHINEVVSASPKSLDREHGMRFDGI